MDDNVPRPRERRAPASKAGKPAEGGKCLHELIADSSAGWEYLQDAEGRMLWVSPSCEAITGHTADEFRAEPHLVLDIVHPEDRASFATHRCERLRGGDADDAEFRIVRPDGGVRWIGHTCRPMSLPGGAGLGRRVSNREITKRKEAELRLTESEQRYRSLFESMDEGFAHCGLIRDDAGRPSDFRCLTVNAAFLRLTGAPLELVTSRKVLELAPWLDRSWIERFGRIVESGQSERFDQPVAEIGKHYEVFAWRSGPDRFAVVFTDVTERQRAEAQLRELNETLERRVAERTAEAERRAVQLQALAFEVSQVERRERLVLAGILHDHLQQILVAAKLSLDGLEERVGEAGLRSDVRRAAQLLDESLAWCRSVAASLSPPVLQEVGLAGGLGWLARQMQKSHGLQVSLSVAEDWIEPSNAGPEDLHVRGRPGAAPQRRPALGHARRRG